MGAPEFVPVPQGLPTSGIPHPAASEAAQKAHLNVGQPASGLDTVLQKNCACSQYIRAKVHGYAYFTTEAKGKKTTLGLFLCQ